MKIQISSWAQSDDEGNIIIPGGERPIKMCSSDGSGSPLLKDGPFGADIIRFDSDKGVQNHTHPGAHILFVIKGTGYVYYEGEKNKLEPGMCYLIPSMVSHEIKATSELILISVGNDHRALDDQKRMTPISSKVRNKISN